MGGLCSASLTGIPFILQCHSSLISFYLQLHSACAEEKKTERMADGGEEA